MAEAVTAVATGVGFDAAGMFAAADGIRTGLCATPDRTAVDFAVAGSMCFAAAGGGTGALAVSVVSCDPLTDESLPASERG